MNSFLELVLKITQNPNVTDADAMVAMRVIATVLFADVEVTARVQRFVQAISLQLNENDNAIIPPFQPTDVEVEKLQSAFLASGWDLHFYAPDHKFPKGVFYSERINSL